MTTREDLDVQTPIRRDARAHGWVPLANDCKACYLKGWSKLEVTDEVIDEWDTMLRYLSTGIRVDAPVGVLDLDIADRRIVYALFDLASEVFGEDWSERVLIRFTKPVEGSGAPERAKEAWVFALDEPMDQYTGPSFVRPGEDPADSKRDEDDPLRIDGHKIEMFGGASGKQIGAFGPHTPGRYDYAWAEDKSPANTLVSDLPVVTKEQVERFLARSHDLLVARGWVKVPTFGDGHAGEDVYLLEPDLEVITRHGAMTVRELQEGDSVRMREIIGAGTNTDRGRVYEDKRRGVYVWDSADQAKYFLTSAKPVPLTDRVSALGQRLLSRGALKPAEVADKPRRDMVIPAPEVETPVFAVPDDDEVTLEDWLALGWEDEALFEAVEYNVALMQARWLHFPFGMESEQIVDRFTGMGCSIKAFGHMLMPHNKTVEFENDAGETKTAKLNVVQEFLSSPNTLRISGYRFDPSTSTRLVLVEGEDLPRLNMYEPKVYPYSTASPQWFIDFLDYLIPDPEERRFVLNWIARKVQCPWERGVVLTLITPAFGTGRGVLIKIMRHLLGTRWCADVSAAVLMGTSGQAQYDDVFIDKVLVTCDEIALHGASYNDRAKGFERLKGVFDPYPQHRTLNRKQRSIISGPVYYSGLLASNHPGEALPLMEGDRRFAVVACTEQPFKAYRPDVKEFIDRVLPVAGQPDAHMLGAVHQYLMSLETDVVMFHSVPDTLARRTLISDQEGEVEAAIRRFIEKLPADQEAFWFRDLVRRAEDWLKDRPQVRQHFEKNARGVLRKGLDGWKYPAGGVRAVRGVGPSEVLSGVVFRDRVDATPLSRGKYLGDGSGTD